MKPNIYTMILLVLAIGSAIIVSNVFHQGILGTILAILLLISAGFTTKQKSKKQN